jgi:hypothetical protein
LVAILDNRNSNNICPKNGIAEIRKIVGNIKIFRYETFKTEKLDISC